MTEEQIRSLRQTLQQADELRGLMDSIRGQLIDLGNSQWLDVYIVGWKEGTTDTKRTSSYIKPAWAAGQMKAVIERVLRQMLNEAESRLFDLEWDTGREAV